MGEVDPKRRLADWFRQWRSPLRKFLLRRGSVPASDLDDIAQEVFLRLMRYDRTELIEHPQAYLFQNGDERRRRVGDPRAPHESARTEVAGGARGREPSRR